MHILKKISLILISLLLGSCTTEESLNELVKRAGAPLFEGMGNHTHPITTNNSYVQRYFDQGLTIDFAFNHAESARSFRAAQNLDPNCAMCYWGEALALGPNINVTSNGAVIMADHEREAAYRLDQLYLCKNFRPMNDQILRQAYRKSSETNPCLFL